MQGGQGTRQTNRTSRKRLVSISRQVAVDVGGVFWLGLRGFSLWNLYRKTRIFAGFPSNQYQKMRAQRPHLLSHFVGARGKNWIFAIRIPLQIAPQTRPDPVKIRAVFGTVTPHQFFVDYPATR